MRFMIIRKADAETEQGALPSDALVEAMTKYNEELAAAGVMRGGAGLQPTEDAFRIEFNDGEPTVTDGPFAEAKELIAGYTVIETESVEEALYWVRKWPVEDGDGNVRLELRRFYEFEDFGDSFSEDQRGRMEAAFAEHGDETV